jgi:hypothetical protein
MRLQMNGRAVVCLCLMALAAAAFINATRWPLSAKLFPMVVCVPLFLLALAEFLFNVLGSAAEKEGRGKPDAARGEDVDPEVARRQTLWVFAWCFGFFVMVLLFGFSVSVPLFVFLYLRPYGKEGWGISIILTVLAGLAFYGLFVRLLNVHFEPGLLQQWLKSLRA